MYVFPAPREALSRFRARSFPGPGKLCPAAGKAVSRRRGKVTFIHYQRKMYNEHDMSSQLLGILAGIMFSVFFYDGFWLAPGGVKPKMTTSGPNPWFWAQHHGFGPDVVTFGVNPSKTTKNDLIWPKPKVLGPRTGLGLWSFWVFWEGTQENMLPALPAPGRSPLNPATPP